MDQSDENTAVCEKHGLSEVETKLVESVAAGVPQDGTPAYFEYSTSKNLSACVFLLIPVKLGFRPLRHNA